ncbi:MAG: radical SAM protein [Geobacteraceae bacterium]|nr:radical SAM protein [Geobacteraceae bacterium]
MISPIAEQRHILTEQLPKIVLPDSYNYIAVFLTLECNLGCSYCINRFGELADPVKLLSGDEWLAGINRLVSAENLPLTLQGGEPTLHPDFYRVVNGIRSDLNIDLLTNLEVHPQRFMEKISPERLKRDAPYASIRVSYHPETMKIEALAARVLFFLDAGYSIGIWGVLHPIWAAEVLRAQRYCQELGIDFRTKEFLGEHEGVMSGHYSYIDACDRNVRKEVQCRTTELLIGPGGGVYRCHSDLYEGRAALGNILDPDLVISNDFRYCDCFGFCNPCDVKLKTDRFQIFGHTSVEILF